jgi:DNA-binding protein HU-beta
VLGEIQAAVSRGERVTLTGFGTFEPVERPARTGRNPRTGGTLEIAASTTPRFRAGATLRAAVAGAPAGTTPGTGPVVRRRRVSPEAPAVQSDATVSAKPAKGAKPAKPAKAAKPAKGAKAAKPAKGAKPAKPTKAKPTKASGAKKSKPGKKK